MQQEQKPFRTFEHLEVYQAAREFRKAMYESSPAYGATEDELDAVIDTLPPIQQFNSSTIQRLP